MTDETITMDAKAFRAAAKKIKELEEGLKRSGLLACQTAGGEVRENPEIYVLVETIGFAITYLIRQVSYGQETGKTVDNLLRLKDLVNKLNGMI